MNKLRLILHYFQGASLIKLNLYVINIVAVLSVFFPEVFDYYHRLFAQLAAFILGCLTILLACDNDKHEYTAEVENEEEDY